MSSCMDRISLQIPFARLDERAVLPTQGSAQAAGWDLYAVEETVMQWKQKGEKEPYIDLQTLEEVGKKCQKLFHLEQDPIIIKN